jgi:hypothetical protein
MRNVQNKNAGHFGVQKKFSGHGDFLKMEQSQEKWDKLEP